MPTLAAGRDRSVAAWTSTSRRSCGVAADAGRRCRRGRVAADRPGGRPAASARGSTCATGVTFLVGENGSGKSTIVEAVAIAFGLVTRGRVDRRATTPPGPPSRRSQRRCGSSAGSAPGGGASSCAPRRCTAGTPTSSDPRRPRPDVPRDEPRRVVPRGAARPLRLPRLLLPRRAGGGAVVQLDARADRRAARPSPSAAARCSARPTRPCSRPCPARRSSRSATGATRAYDVGASWSWSSTGQAYLDDARRYLRHVLGWPGRGGTAP